MLTPASSRIFPGPQLAAMVRNDSRRFPPTSEALTDFSIAQEFGFAPLSPLRKEFVRRGLSLLGTRLP